MSERRDSHAPASRRAEERLEVRWSVDCESEETFLYAYITNVSSLGLFVRTEHPLPIGTRMQLSFAPEGFSPFELRGEVAWINPTREHGQNPNPGMGVRFLDLALEDRERLVDAIHTIAYVRGEPEQVN
jgi:type IV pilus assembly protein PilZ